MCKSKEEFPPFGKVCDVHNNGNKATIEMCSQITGVASEKVNAVFNDLRKEGKHLPAPTPDEVKEYVSSQVFTAKYDPKIQDKSRNRIVNWWRKARDTQPSGGLMHAWKNTLPQTLARYRRTAFASVAMFSIAITSACGSTPPRNNVDNTSSPIATTAPATPSEEATVKPSESAKPTPTQDTSVAGKTISKLDKQGIEIGKTVKVKGGSYPQYEVTKDAPIAKVDKSKHSGGLPKGWTQKDLNQAHIVSGNYMMNFALDNPTLNDYDSNKEIFAKQVEKVASPKYRSAFVNAVRTQNGTPFMSDTFKENFAGDTSKGFRYVTDGKTPRIADMSQLKLTSSEEWNGDAYFQYDGIITMNVVDKKGEPYTMDRNISYGMTVTKIDGKFYMSGAEFKTGQYANPVPAK